MTEDPLHDIVEKINAFDPELQSLFTSTLLFKMANMLETVGEDPQTPPRTQSMIALVRNVLNLVGLAHETAHSKHEDWTRTGDKRLDEVWTEYVGLLDNLTFSAGDLPDDVAERLTDGQATEEDYEVIKRLMAERAGLDPDKVIVERQEGHQHTDATSDEVYGQYL